MVLEAERVSVPTSKEAFVFIGPPASGKSSHTNTFTEIIGGKLIRGRDVFPELVSQYEAGRQLIPDDKFLPALERTLEAVAQEARGLYFFDNIPRTPKQAEVLVDWSARINAKLRTAVLVLPRDEVLYRFQRRLVCPECGTSYHPNLKPSRVDGKCDRDLSDLKPRVGDKEDNIDQAYSHYEDILKGVVPILARAGSVEYISAHGTVSETASTIALKFNLQSFTPRS